MMLDLSNPYLSYSHFTDKHRPLNSIKGFISPSSTYSKSLTSNLQTLKLKYPFKQETQLKQLLEELENDINTVSDMIQQEQNQMKGKIKEVEMLKIEEVILENTILQGDVSMELPKTEQQQEKQAIVAQNKLLKRSFLKLYYKMQQMKKELVQKEDELHKTAIKMQKLKTANQLLLEERMRDEEQESSNMYIC